MKNIVRVVVMMMMCVLVPLAARAVTIDQAMPGPAGGAAPFAAPAAGGASAGVAAPDSPARQRFAAGVQLDTFRTLAIQHMDQVKILDSWARQNLSEIRNRQSIDGQDSLYTVLDMMIRPEAWQERNFIFVQAVPIRQALANMAGVDAKEAERLRKEGLVSPAFLERDDVAATLRQIGLDARHAKMVTQVQRAYMSFRILQNGLMIIPPAPGGAGKAAEPWRHPLQLAANLPDAEAIEREFEARGLPPMPEYSTEQSLRSVLALRQLWDGWIKADAGMVNSGINGFMALAPTIDPANYPSAAKRTTELWYNRTFYGTILNVFLYFISMTLFLMVAVGVTNSQRLRKNALRLFTVAVAFHLVSMSIRYWLAGRWPTQNQFESVLGAALLGCIVGWVLEVRKKTGLFGMAFSFVGFLAMTACMAAPYMFGRDIGGAIEKTSGILQTYWLKIHVNIVISSYALIAGSFILGVTYLLTKQWYWVNPLEPGEEGGSGQWPVVSGQAGSGGGGVAMATSTLSIAAIEKQRAARLEVLDQANMVVLQMAFWFLGIGIICGAVWADQSWGRPWGWDPKETFALVTWMVYLIIVHVRMITTAKATATAWLSVAGFGIMMFNWIGVNYFLVGLHSYA